MKLKDLVRGTRPAHTHRNEEGDTWQCNSPYCEEPNAPQEHPDKGGPVPTWNTRPAD